MPIDRLLDYLATTLAEAYRRELDQEENVWRSLPFFAATLALQLTVLVQLRGWLGGVAGPVLVAAVVLLGLAGAGTLAALLFLALSIWPADFDYVANDPTLLDYARQAWVEAAGRPGATPDSVAEAALSAVKTMIMQQLANVAANNRGINRARAACRTRAGLAILGSVMVILTLVGLAVVTSF